MTKKLVSFDDQAEPGEGLPAAVKAELNNTYGAEALADPESELRQAAGQVFPEIAKFDHGGAVMRPVRQPTLAYGKQFPNGNAPYDILWASGDGQTLYATARDRTLRKSTTKGRTWEAKGNYASGSGVGGSQVFVKTKAGTLLTFELAFPLSNKVLRSTDDGMTWTTVFTDPARQALGCAPMHATSMCQDPVTGYIYWGEYQTGQVDTILVYRSTDDGATWTVFHTFPGPASSDPWKVRHIHSVEYDHVMQRIVVMTGDDEPKAGMYRVNSAGTALEPLLTNDQCPNWPSQTQARSICYIPFPDYICWGGDTTSSPWVMRMHRSQVGQPSPAIERIYRANSTMWFAAKASPDGSRWLMTASQESTAPLRLDAASHVYAIEDQGATVTEVGVVNMNSTALVAPFPLGGSNPTGGGDQVWLAVSENENRTVWRCQLTRGGGQAVPQAEPLPAVSGLQTVSSGYVTVPAGGQITFGATQAPTHPRPRFRMFEASVRGIPTQSANLQIEVQSGVGNPIWQQPTSTSYRRLLNQEWSPYVLDMILIPSYELLFVLKNTGSSAVSGVAHVTFGFGVDLTP